LPSPMEVKVRTCPFEGAAQRSRKQGARRMA
jgi:hypothetical protein